MQRTSRADELRARNQQSLQLSLQRSADEVRDAVAGLEFEVTDTPLADSPFMAGLAGVFDETALVALDIIGLTPECRSKLKAFPGSWQGVCRGVVDPYAWRLLSSTAMRQHHAPLAVEPTASQDRGRFDLLDPLLIEGSLGAALRDGGPHRHSAAGTALDTAREFRRELIDDRLDDLLLLSGDSWSPWFRWRHDGWTHGWLITDLGSARAYVLCAQATD